MKKNTAPRHIFIDMHAGVAGDMFISALLDLEHDPSKRSLLIEDLQEKLQAFLGEDITLTSHNVLKNGIHAVYSRFHTPEDHWFQSSTTPNHLDHHHEYPPSSKKKNNTSSADAVSTAENKSSHGTHRSFGVIQKMLHNSKLPERVRTRAETTFTILGRAEASVHDQDLENVHFHEVGSLDALCEVVGVCLLLEAFNVVSLSAGPFVLGSGTVNCAHGIIPVPVPAVTQMLTTHQSKMTKISEATGELSTPTGVALVLALTKQDEKGTKLDEPSTAPEKKQSQTLYATGWGAGTKDLKRMPNVLRVMLMNELNTDTIGTPLSITNIHNHSPQTHDRVIELQTSLDDVTGENLSILMEKMFEEGALDVHFQQIIMKKSRPGIIVSILCTEEDRQVLGDILLSTSPAIGYRYHTLERTKMVRYPETVIIDGVEIAVKVALSVQGKTRIKAEDFSLREALKKLPYTYSELVYQVKKAYYLKT